MDDRDNYCDVCRKPIIESVWVSGQGRMLTGEEEIETPVGLVNLSRFGDGVCHASCVAKAVKADEGAGI